MIKTSIGKCRSCGAKIIWVKTKAGKNMPIDFDVKFIDDEEFSAPIGHISHFSTCPVADKFRKPKND